MTSVNPGQAIVIAGVPNLRDMGGWATPGGVVASGEVYRSAEFSGLTGEAATAFAALGVRAVYDLCTTVERTGRI